MGSRLELLHGFSNRGTFDRWDCRTRFGERLPYNDWRRKAEGSVSDHA